MFSKKLRNEIASEVDKIRIVDPHTHLKEDNLTSHVVDVLSYHWILSELNSVGLDYKDVFTNKALDLETRLKSIIPFFSKMRNTATSQCVYNIFRDLYGFEEELNENNYKTLLELSLKASSRDDWADIVFKKTNIVSFVTGVGNGSKKGRIRSDFNLMAEINYLFWPSGSSDNLPWFEEAAFDETKYIEAIEKTGGIHINSVKDIKTCLDSFLANAIGGRAKFFATYLPIEFRFVKIDDISAEQALKSFRKLNGQSKQDLDILVKYVTWYILEVLNEMKTTLQIAVGAEYFICGGRSLSRFESTWVSDMVKVCYDFPGIKFDFMNASSVMAHEMEVAAKMIRNFYLQNMWWHTYVPSCIKALGEKLEVVPVVKLGGFYCDAYYCELTYGKLTMVKDAIVDVLCSKVENKVYSLDYALTVAERLLHSNPKEIYGI